MRLFHGSPLTLIACLTTACVSGHSPAGAGGAGALVADTIVRPVDERLASASDIAVTPQGELYIADLGGNQVVRLSSTGEVLGRLGREGAGPGEFRQPRSLFYGGDSLRVVDVGNARVSVFSADARFVRSYAAPPRIVLAGMAFNARGDGLVAAHGIEGVLAQRIGPDGAPGPPVGHPEIPTPREFDFGGIKNQLSHGHVPASLMNYTAPALGSDGQAWILGIVAGTVRYYSATDSLRWEASLPDTIALRLRQALFGKTKHDTIPNHFAFPTLFPAARVVGGELWVLLQEPTGEPAQIEVLDASGHWSRSYRVRGATDIQAFAVDTAGHQLFLLDPAEGTVLRAEYPH